MKPTDKVRIYPHGHPDQAAVGRVDYLSPNGHCVIIAFTEKPPFAYKTIHTDSILFLARRVSLNGKPWGPWIELGNSGHYEIEPLE